MQRDVETRKAQFKLRQMASIAEAEAIGSPFYFIHMGILAFGSFCVIALFDRWSYAAIVAVYLTLLTLEKAFAGWAVRAQKASSYPMVLGLLSSRAFAYNVLVVAVWNLDGDVFKMAALALLVAATINIFVFHATYPMIIVCVVGPIWVGIAAIAALIWADMGASAQSVSAALVVVCITPYFLLTLMKAQKKFGELDETRDALKQSQKQDALGKLVSGVAHDFNNILAVTLGSAELIKDASAADKDKLADEIIKAAERGASLSAQLLAFGRRSQLAPAGHSIRQTFDDLHTMLDRVLPEHIATSLSVAPDTPHVYVDRQQLETALLNLAVNARDAMTDGGTLEIFASEYDLRSGDPMVRKYGIVPGRYTCISVSDNGIGVAKDQIDEVFDPFFTTKSVGEGAGLGLSMVLGFAQQSGGAVTFDSTVGEGTVVTLYLPSTTKLAAPAPDIPAHAQGVPGTGHVLLVEDETPLRAVLASQLEAGGYNVSVAANGQEAEAILRTGAQPDVLVTDLVMPGNVQGLQLAQIAREEVSDIRVVLVSGYPDASMSEAQMADPAVVMLRKPIHKEDLLYAVQRSLAPA